MIHVLATISVKPGKRDEFLTHFKANVPLVLAEDGCVSYTPTVDVDSGLAPQEPCRDNAVTIIEAWDSLDALKAHLQAPHMRVYKEKTKHLTTGVSLRITEPA